MEIDLALIMMDMGEVTDVCIKRKIRDRLQESGLSIFVQSDEKRVDDKKSLGDRYNAFIKNKKIDQKDIDDVKEKVCKEWFDVRAFGQVFAFKGDEKKGVSIPIRGPLTIQSAFSLEPISITETQITKSVSGTTSEKRGSDTMGMKYRVDNAVYVTYGAITPQLAERTGFSGNDADKIKEVLPKLFQGDASSARPEGSMRVNHLVWWEHNCKLGQYPSVKVHDSLRELLEKNGDFKKENLEKKLEDLKPEVIQGF